jgi:predicted GNAT superfamily acetyltransferase
MPVIRAAEPQHLPAAARLLAGALGFSPADAVPAWLMRTTDECGGVTLVALEDGELVGALHSIRARADTLFTCGLAVAGPHRGNGVALALKREQRRRARGAGIAAIRWTADPTNGAALRLYLHGLGARLVAYHAGLHDGLRADPGHPQDDVDVVWALDAAPPQRIDDTHTVAVPWSQPTPGDRARVRAEMRDLLARGYVGADVELDRAARHCAVVFTPP